ncbi:MAG: efflux RND transporter periplasmic adaptor subunit, partial [Planctomycetota bacterium]
VIEVAPALVAGGFFEQGEVLLRIDPIDYDLAEKEAAMRVAGAELRLAQELADAEVAARQWDSVRGGGTAPPLVLREPQIAEARAARVAAQAALEKARRDVGRCTITAPYAGRVRAEDVDLGEFVQRGQELAVVYAVDFAEVRLPLPDADLAFLDLPLSYRGEAPGGGPVVEIVVRFAGGVHSWTGRIVRTEGELDPKSRMVVAVARVIDPYGRSEERDRPPLAVGMFVDATIRGRRLASAVSLPRVAMRGPDRVLVVGDDDRIEIRSVKPLKAERHRIILASGVEPGERIVVSPLENYVDGMAVRVLVREPERGGER